MEIYEEKRSQNSYLTRILREQTSLLESYYDAAGSDKIKEADKELILNAAADLKSSMATIQNLIGVEDKKSEKKKNEDKKTPDDEEDPFLDGLEGKKGKK